MSSWLKDWDKPVPSNMSGMEEDDMGSGNTSMGGMMSADDMAALAATDEIRVMTHVLNKFGG